MCLVLLSFKAHPEYPLVLLANRDEFFRRPTATAEFWPECPDLLAGRDLQAGGTWLGIRKSGRFACVTNYRDPAKFDPNAPSRGRVVTDFLTDKCSVATFVSQSARFNSHNPFNLLAGSVDELWYFTNVKQEIRRLPPGTHGLSNGLLNDSWPKVEEGRVAVRETLNRQSHTLDDLFQIMSDGQIAPDERLPNTGVALSWERILSPRFISTPDYGTRSTTIVLVHASGRVDFVERRHDLGDGRSEDAAFSWSLPA